jgi:hypothetical protein
MSAAILLIGFVSFNPQLIFWYIGVVPVAYSFFVGINVKRFEINGR